MHLFGDVCVVMLHGFDAVTHDLRYELAFFAIYDQICGERMSTII